MLHLIQDTTDQFFSLLNEDPVRPTIPIARRVGPNRSVFVLEDHNQVQAITCVSYQPGVPKTESELFEIGSPTVAVFYTIWSYQSGAGRQLILSAVDYIRQTNPEIRRFVTLSPKTEMARKFHLRNGAVIFMDNPETVNYEYLIFV